MNLVITPHRLSGFITPPPSKSQAHRVLIAAALAGGERVIHNLADSEDISATKRCLAALMAPPAPGAVSLPVLDCGESGSTLRFLLPLALVLRGGGVFTGRGRLMQRPLGPYLSLFEARGVSVSQGENSLTVSGALRPGRFDLPGDVSSQFITGLLFALPLLEGDSSIVLTTDLESRGYVDMTLETLSLFGVTVRWDGGRHFAVPGGRRYAPCEVTVEADYSQAAFYCAANGIGNSVVIGGLNAASAQGDRVILDYAARLSAPGAVTLDVSQCPDLVPALALHAALRDGERTSIVGARRLRIKESDRLEAVAGELSALGARITAGADFLEIEGVPSLRGGVTVSARNDHRIAMMLAVAATRADRALTLSGAESVGKSYPGFWDDYTRLGGIIR